MVNMANAAISGVLLNKPEELPDLYAHYKLIPTAYAFMSSEDQIMLKRERRKARNKKGFPRADSKDYAFESNPLDMFWSHQRDTCFTFESRNNSKNMKPSIDSPEGEDDPCSIAIGPIHIEEPISTHAVAVTKASCKRTRLHN